MQYLHAQFLKKKIIVLFKSYNKWLFFVVVVRINIIIGILWFQILQEKDKNNSTKKGFKRMASVSRKYDYVYNGNVFFWRVVHFSFRLNLN